MSSKMQFAGCSRHHDGSEWLKWHDVALPWYDIPFSVDYCQLTCKLSIPDRWGIIHISSKMQLMSCSRAVGRKFQGRFFCLYLIGTLHYAESGPGKVENLLCSGLKYMILIICKWNEASENIWNHEINCPFEGVTFIKSKTKLYQNCFVFLSFRYSR